MRPDDGKEAKSDFLFVFLGDVPEFRLQNANVRGALIAILLRRPTLTVKRIFT